MAVLVVVLLGSNIPMFIHKYHSKHRRYGLPCPRDREVQYQLINTSDFYDIYIYIYIYIYIFIYCFIYFLDYIYYAI